MSQKRLSRLAILIVEKEILEELEFKILISNFTSEKSEKNRF